MSGLSLGSGQPLPGRDPERERLADHLVFVLSYASVYAAFVFIQVVLLDSRWFGGEVFPLLMTIWAFLFLLGFFPSSWLCWVVCAPRHDLIRHGIVGCVCGITVIGGGYGLYGFAALFRSF